MRCAQAFSGQLSAFSFVQSDCRMKIVAACKEHKSTVIQRGFAASFQRSEAHVA